MRNRNCRRDRIEIVADILKKAKGGSRKTHIMYTCNLSVTQNEKYLQALLDSGLLASTSDGQYITTPEGIDAIGIAQKARRTFSEVYEKLRKK
jgi:predicted transcriptional regulator